MGVVEFSVLGAVQKFRSLIAGPTPPAAAAEGEEVARQTSGPPSPATPTRSRSGAADTTPPLPARPGGGRRAIALRRQISSPQLLRCHAVRYSLHFHRLLMPSLRYHDFLFFLLLLPWLAMEEKGKSEVEIAWYYDIININIK